MKPQKDTRTDISKLGAYATELSLFGDPDEAESSFEKIRSTAKTRDDLYCLLLCHYAAFLTSRKKSIEKAILIYEEVLKIDPEHCIALGNLAMLKHQFGEYNQAEKLYNRAVSLFPEHSTVLGAFANLIKNYHKNYTRSKKLFERAISLSKTGDDTELLGNFAVLLHGNLGEYEEAEKIYIRSINAPGGHENANVLSNYALFLCDVRKKFDLAQRTYERALEADSMHSNSLYNFGVFFETIRGDVC